MTPTPEQVATALRRHQGDYCPAAWWVCPEHLTPFVARQRIGTRGVACPACGQCCAWVRAEGGAS